MKKKKIKIKTPDKWTEFIIKEMNYVLPDDCRGGVVVDCGCNVGAFELVYETRFDKYYCFDASEQNLQILRKNLEQTNVEFEAAQKACWKESGQIKKVMAHSNCDGEIDYFGNSGNFSIVEATNPDGISGHQLKNSIDEVETISIEEIIDKFSPIKVLKVDIEGGEFEFLLNKDLSKIEFIVGEIHNSKSPQWLRLIKFITKTHRITYTDYEHVFTFRNKNE